VQTLPVKTAGKEREREGERDAGRGIEINFPPNSF